MRFRINTADVRVNAPVEYVGLTEDRAMETPKGWWSVGWYELGPLPGQEGSAVLAGHLDSDTGKAVFWDLDKLRIGDEVSVIDRNGNTTRFRVRDKEVYYADNAPIEKIFGGSGGSHLNLITCDGVFDRQAGVYDRRLVVFTDRVD
ncbi:MAG: class F sortase [Chloroflexota bacterium]|nr:class F sortase [Chloroflexota bacterium]